SACGEDAAQSAMRLSRAGDTRADLHPLELVLCKLFSLPESQGGCWVVAPDPINSQECFMRLKGKKIVVPGGASGIGEAFVRLAATEGAAEIVIYDVNTDAGERIAAEVGAGCR